MACPPGPICNPSTAALEAVANPGQGDELYFVPDGNGGHVFAETFDQHLKNVAHWRQRSGSDVDRLAPAPYAPSNSITTGPSGSSSDKQKLDALINKTGPFAPAPKQ